MKKANWILMACVAATLTMAACRPTDEEAVAEPMTQQEAEQALTEAQLSNEGEALTADVVEISTSFTIGAAVQDAAEELRAFAASQIPCSTVTREDGQVTIDFGTLEDECTFRGRTYAGVVQISIERNAPGEVEVTHTWEELTNGRAVINGGSTVTWSRAEGTRHVVHQFVLTRDDRTLTAEGDRVQQFIDPELRLAGGIQIDGERSWSNERGQWTLDIDGIQMRGQDPAPQAGVWTLTNPEGKTLRIEFERIDDETIAAHIEGTRREFTVNIRKQG